jgi:hypothetical protein
MTWEGQNRSSDHRQWIAVGCHIGVFLVLWLILCNTVYQRGLLDLVKLYLLSTTKRLCSFDYPISRTIPTSSSSPSSTTSTSTLPGGNGEFHYIITIMDTMDIKMGRRVRHLSTLEKILIYRIGKDKLHMRDTPPYSRHYMNFMPYSTHTHYKDKSRHKHTEHP